MPAGCPLTHPVVVGPLILAGIASSATLDSVNARAGPVVEHGDRSELVDRPKSGWAGTELIDAVRSTSQVFIPLQLPKPRMIAWIGAKLADNYTAADHGCVQILKLLLMFECPE